MKFFVFILILSAGLRSLADTKPELRTWKEIDLMCNELIGKKVWSVLSFRTVTNSHPFFYGIGAEQGPGPLTGNKTGHVNSESKFYDESIASKFVKIPYRSNVYTEWRFELGKKGCIRVMTDIRKSTDQEFIEFGKRLQEQNPPE